MIGNEKVWWILHKVFGWNYVCIASSPFGMPSHHQVQRVNLDRNGRPFVYHFNTIVYLDQQQSVYDITPLTFQKPGIDAQVAELPLQNGNKDKSGSVR